jgi:hypothetical protein
MVDVVTSVAECEQGSGSVGDPPHYAPGTFAALWGRWRCVEATRLPDFIASASGSLVVVDLAAVARRSDEAVHDARAELVQAVREASRQGLTQAQIAQLIGRSQPEVSRLLRFHGRGPLARRLRRHAREVRELIVQA